MVTIDSARRVDIDCMDRRNCRQEATAALRAVEAGMGVSLEEIILLDTGAAWAEGAKRCMAALAAEVEGSLTFAASDTAGDVDAVHHDNSPEARGIIRYRLWFL